MLGSAFTTDISGLIIEFDVSTNRGSFELKDDEVAYQSSDDLLLDPFKKFGIGAIAYWPSPKTVIISFGKNATVTSKTFPEWRPYVIADRLDKFAFIGPGETFRIDEIAPENKPATTAVADAPWTEPVRKPC